MVDAPMPQIATATISALWNILAFIALNRSDGIVDSLSLDRSANH
jgi:hypothetical protein